MGMGDRGIMLLGRHPEPARQPHQHLDQAGRTPPKRAAPRIEVLDAGQWQAGDEIVLASTDYNPRQAERRTITAVNGNTITLDEPLEYMHFGEITYGVDERGEVGLLTRNIKVQASEDAARVVFRRPHHGDGRPARCMSRASS